MRVSTRWATTIPTLGFADEASQQSQMSKVAVTASLSREIWLSLGEDFAGQQLHTDLGRQNFLIQTNSTSV